MSLRVLRNNARVAIFVILVASLAAQQRTVVPSSSTATGRRVALVVGNRAYPRQLLVNSVNDANDIGTVWRSQLGFLVTVVTDVGRQAFERAVNVFADSLAAGDVSLFY